MSYQSLFLVFILFLMNSSCTDTDLIDAVEVENHLECPEDFNFDSILVSNYLLVGLNHSFPNHLKGLIRTLPYKIEKRNNVIIDTHSFIRNSDSIFLNYYILDSIPYVIEKCIKKKSSKDNLLIDSLSLIEYYYISSKCCVKEQFSVGCANISRMSTSEGTCFIEFELMKQLSNEIKNAANTAPPSTRRNLRD